MSDPIQPMSVAGEALFLQFVQTVADHAIFAMDPAGHILYWNAGAQRIMGFDASDVIGRQLHDIFTQEDAKHVRQTLAGALAPERVVGVETGSCPHTAVRDDPSMNIDAIAQLERRFPDGDIVLVESGGDNLTLTFSRSLADYFVFVIDVAEGDKIPRKGGPGIIRSDLLVINKIDLAPYVGASLEVMERDARRMRGERPFVFTNLRTGTGVDTIVDFIVHEGVLA